MKTHLMMHKTWD